MKLRGGAYDSAAMLTASLARAASQWLLLWLFAWSGGADSAGMYAFALGIAAPIFIVLELGLRNVYITSRVVRSFFTYFRIRAAASVLAVILTTALAWSVYSQNVVVVALVALIKFLDSMLDIAFASLQVRGKIYSVAAAMLINSVVTVGAAGAFYLAFSSLIAALFGSVLASLITALIYIVPVLRFEAKSGSLAGRSKSVGPIMRDGIPLGLATGMTTLLTYIPLYFIALDGDQESVGIFAVIIYFLTFANLFFNSVQKAILHTIVSARTNNGHFGMLRRLRRVSIPLILFGFITGLFVGNFGAPILRIIYGPSFVVDGWVLWPIAVAIMVLPCIYITGMLLLTCNVYWLQSLINGISMVAVVAIGLALRSDFTLSTAAMLTLVGILSRAVLGVATSAFYSHRIDPHNRRRVSRHARIR